MKKLIPGSFLLALLISAVPFENQISQYLDTIERDFGIFENEVTIGETTSIGELEYNPKLQEYSFLFSEDQKSGESHPFHYLYKSIQGDFILRAHLSFEDDTGSGSNAGWIIRNNLSSKSAEVIAQVNNLGTASLESHAMEGLKSEEIQVPLAKVNVLQLEKRGDVYYFSSAKFGEPFTTVKIENENLRNELFAGLFFDPGSEGANGKVIVNNVRIIKPAGPDFEQYQEYLGSNLEILNVETGNRKVLYTSAHSIQAPNWVNKDRDLVYNSNGYLYRYDLNSERVEQIETGFAINNNNDHVFSFDESILGISHHNQEDGGVSSLYIMDPAGDTLPQKITKDGVGASYLHGISPDNKTLLFTGERKGKMDIYSIDIETKKEIQLTDTDYLDDGSEYSSDGEYIYFNSNRNGKMHLWRMKPDGSEQEQLTFDPNHNDWFPHISPDGKWIAFISFPPEIDSGDHPFYQHCLLRLMPVDGGEPKVIAYIYGGQGTINVPSWSKDSKHIAFVTNTACY
ncbi:MAG: TolB family protein [Salegentibacter sp.]|uniref:WD40-like Beta Propeller Repeat n=1 Tax=Salegentibacter flavus TaxID=287099 RepID=A0A1I5CZA8_9FLAO|nr:MULTISPECIES: TolB family protein [Salegentibacter]MDR9458314.1 TolB family protein [Salegentibacter sp.]SFN92302.1 WD40-like Beta Propeller Repeat [Salegentibacter flavus]